MATNSKLGQLRDILLVQFGTRFVTFGINILIARVAPQNEYGVTFVSFQFYLNLTSYCHQFTSKHVSKLELLLDIRQHLEFSFMMIPVTASQVVLKLCYPVTMGGGEEDPITKVKKDIEEKGESFFTGFISIWSLISTCTDQFSHVAIVVCQL